MNGTQAFGRRALIALIKPDDFFLPLDIGWLDSGRGIWFSEFTHHWISSCKFVQKGNVPQRRKVAGAANKGENAAARGGLSSDFAIGVFFPPCLRGSPRQPASNFIAASCMRLSPAARMVLPEAQEPPFQSVITPPAPSTSGISATAASQA